MKRLMLFTAGLIFILCAWAFAAEQAAAPAPAPAPASASGAVKAKITKMRAPGIILEITDSRLKIERKVKDDVELMEFVLEKPVKFKVGDKVRISYVDDNGRRIVTRIVKTTDLKAKKQIKPLKENGIATGNTVPANAVPPVK